MRNIQAIAGSCLWAAVAGLLMLATFQPVNVTEPVQFSAATAAPQAAA